MPRKTRAAPETATPPAPTPVAVAEHDDAGGPVSPEDFSELEVQQMLEARDQSGDRDAPLVPGSVPAPPPEPPSIPPNTLHALDHAPKNSKIVVILNQETHKPEAMLATPDGVTRLPDFDPAHKLPEGARIQKIGDGRFVATQLSATVIVPDLETPTAALAIVQFIPHFHNGVVPRP